MERGDERLMPDAPHEHDMQVHADDSDAEQDFDLLPQQFGFRVAVPWPEDEADGHLAADDAMDEGGHGGPGDRHVRMWNIRGNLGGLCAPRLPACALRDGSAACDPVPTPRRWPSAAPRATRAERPTRARDVLFVELLRRLLVARPRTAKSAVDATKIAVTMQRSYVAHCAARAPRALARARPNLTAKLALCACSCVFAALSRTLPGTARLGHRPFLLTPQNAALVRAALAVASHRPPTWSLPGNATARCCALLAGRSLCACCCRCSRARRARGAATRT